MYKKVLNLSLVSFISVSLIACSSSTTIRVSDPQAKIFVNGEYVGTGQGTYGDAKISGATNHVAIRKDGCREAQYVFSRSEEADVGAIIGGFFLIVPFLWVMKYRPYRSYEYNCDGSYAY